MHNDASDLPELLGADLFRAYGHDIRNLLHGASLHAQLIHAGTNDEELRESAAVIRDACDQTGRVVDDVFDTVRWALGIHGRRYEAVDLREAAAEALAMACREPGPGAREYVLGGGSATVLADRAALVRALCTLGRLGVGRARALPLDVHVDPSSCELTLQDDGPNLDASTRARLFAVDPTLRGEARRQNLSIVLARAILAGMGARLSIEESASSVGLRLTLTFPDNSAPPQP